MPHRTLLAALTLSALLPLAACDKPAATPPATSPSHSITPPPVAQSATPTAQPATPPTRSPALSRDPIDGRVPNTGGPSQPPLSNAPANNSASGQLLTPVFPTADEVSVFKDNQWLPARIRQREPQRALVEFDNRPSSENQWVTPDRVRPR